MSIPQHAAPGPTEVRVEIEHNADGTTARFAKDDIAARGIVKAAGFRFSRNLDGGPGWYLNRTWGEATRAQRVASVVAQFEADEVVVENPPAAALSAAEREAAKVERAAERADRLSERAEKLSAGADAEWEKGRKIGEHIPFGQPILAGHHSQRRAERDRDRMRASADKSVALSREADRVAAAAATAAATAKGTPVVTRLRRIERKSAELRDVERRLAATKSQPGEDYRDRMEAMRAQLVDEIAHDRAMVEASGRKVYSKADVSKGDVVVVRGQARKVVRVNAKSVSVATGYSWTDTVPYLEITRVVPAAAAG